MPTILVWFLKQLMQNAKNKNKKAKIKQNKKIMEEQGIDPCAFCMQSRRSTIWATPPDLLDSWYVCARGLVVMIVACQVMDPGSIPGERIFWCVVSWVIGLVVWFLLRVQEVASSILASPLIFFVIIFISFFLKIRKSKIDTDEIWTRAGRAHWLSKPTP